jgi:dipeptidyl aminopeptidase/acylaminoacyl peptidase
MSADHACGTWLQRFPGNVKWSNAMQIVTGMAPWAAIAMEEVDRIAERMRARAGESDLDAVWIQEWTAMADRVAAAADAAAKEGRQISAGNNYMRAGNYYYSAERFYIPGEQKLAVYRKALRCWHAALERLYPNVERVDVPFEGKGLAAYFMKAPGAGARAPTVVVFNGMDNAKEMSVLFAGVEFAKRGLHTLAIDGPGQSETLRLRGLHGRPDYEVAGIAAYDYAARRPDVDPQKIAIMGYSFGGYYAARSAAFEKRYAAGVSMATPYWDMHAWQLRLRERAAADPKATTANTFQWRWVMGAANDEEGLEIAKRFTLVDIARNIECPYLVTHGANDRLVKVDQAEKLFAEIGSKKKQLKIFTAEEGGAEHANVDNRQLGVDFVADWLVANMHLPPR